MTTALAPIALGKGFTASGVCKCDSSPLRRLDKVWPAGVAKQEWERLVQRTASRVTNHPVSESRQDTLPSSRSGEESRA